MADNAELIARLRDLSERCKVVNDRSGNDSVSKAFTKAADAIAILHARIADLEAQIARDAAFNEASRHYGEADLEKAVDHMQEAIRIVGQHGSKRRV